MTRLPRLEGPIVTTTTARRIAASLALAALAWLAPGAASAQDAGRVLGAEDIRLLGAGLRVEPVRQTVPKDIATIVSVFLAAPAQPDEPLPGFASDAVVRGTLRGPSFNGPVEISTRPNTPFNIPPLSVPGLHTLDDIRFESGGQLLLRGVPESVTIEVIEKLLVTQVTARALTAQEIREKGIVFDKSNFQAYNFTAAFAVGDATPVPLTFPVVLPTLQGADEAATSTVGLSGFAVPQLRSVETIIPDTLKLQRRIPNLRVVGFTLRLEGLPDQKLIAPPIPGIVVIPGDIGFLNQFFNVALIVGNVAPSGSNLVVTDLRAEIVLPPGEDNVAASDDDPLAMARTVRGESPRVQVVAQAGADGKLGTGDDIPQLAPGDTGSAEYLVEGRREGTHVVEMQMTGTLNGLPGGPVTIRGRAAGSVLVRNPRFTLTFTHPELINAGESYTLDVTVTNTSESPANFVSVNLFPRRVSGAALVGSSTREIESIAPNDSATVSFDLIAQVSGPVTAATLLSDGNVEGRFDLKTSVGELGVPLSPDSLVLPRETRWLPAGLRNAALGLLGKAWAVATAPAAALPKDVTRFSKKVVYDRAIELAEAGFRHDLGEPIEETAWHLALDYLGNNYTRLADRTPGEDLEFVEADVRGFDELRRRSVRGDVFGHEVATLVGAAIDGAGVAVTHRRLAEAASWRPPHVSVLAHAPGGRLPVTLSMIDEAGRRVGGLDADGKLVSQIPFGDAWRVEGIDGASRAEAVVLASPAPGAYRLVLTRVEGVDAATPFRLSLVVPAADGGLRQLIFDGITRLSRPATDFPAADPWRVTIEFAPGAPAGPAVSPSVTPIGDPALRITSVVQQPDADRLTLAGALVNSDTITPPPSVGRVVAVLFNEEVTPAAVQDRVPAGQITRFAAEANEVVGVALQPGRRIAFVALRDPVGRFVPRTFTAQDIPDAGGRPMTPQTLPITMRVTDEAAVVTGRIRQADGTPVPFADVRLLYVVVAQQIVEAADGSLQTGGAYGQVGISRKLADAEGRFSWDFVLKDVPLVKISAVDPDTGASRTIGFTVQRDGQRLNVEVVLFGRGAIRGRTTDERGRPLPATTVRATSLTDSSQYGAVSDADGNYAIGNVPVGNVFLEAVNVTARARVTASERIPVAGGTVTRDLALFEESARPPDVRYGTVRGSVRRGDREATPAADVPVIVYYTSLSQDRVTCPQAAAECAVAVVRTDADGAFEAANLPAGQLRVQTFDQATYQQGEVRVQLVGGATVPVTILLGQGLGTVRGIVLTADGAPVAGAEVGGGLSLTTTATDGTFTLTDVPVGRQEIVAVSQVLESDARTLVDLVRAGEEVNATLVLRPRARLAGVVRRADGSTPAAGVSVFAFQFVEGSDGPGGIDVAAEMTADAQGRFSSPLLPLGDYVVSAVLPDGSEGEVRAVPLRFAREIARADLQLRGRGRVTGVVLDADGLTPLRAAVGISGPYAQLAGGRVLARFVNAPTYAIAQSDLTSGRFAIEGVWTGPFTLAAVGPFSPDPISFESEMPAPGATVDVTLRLQPTARITGVVTLPDGVTPAPRNVRLKFRSKAYKLVCRDEADVCQVIPQGIQNFDAITDDEGRFVFEPLNPGPFTITAEDPVTGRVAQLEGELRAGQDASFSIRLLGLAPITVRVRGNDTVTPIPGARVEIEQPDFPHRRVVLIADAQGVVTIDDFSEGAFAALATDVRNGFRGRANAVVTNEGQNDAEPVVLDVYLFDATGSVTGRSTQADAVTPIAGAQVVVSNHLGPIAFTVTDGEGDYAVDAIPLGDVFVRVLDAATAGRGFGQGRIDFDGQQVIVNVRQAPIGLVTGRVIDRTTLEPLRNWQVTLLQRTPFGQTLPELNATSGLAGEFQFPGVIAGRFDLIAQNQLSGRPTGSGRVDGYLAREGQRVDLSIPARVNREALGRVEGRVVDPSGVPSGHALVELIDVRGVTTSVTADGGGAFAVEDVRLGRVRIRARAQVGRDTGEGGGILDFEGQTLPVIVQLAGTTTITGTVYQADGVTPLSRAVLEAVGRPTSLASDAAVSCGTTGSPCRAAADAQGRFSLAGVPFTEFTITATDPVTGASGSVGGVVGRHETKDVRIVLTPSARLTGRVGFPDLAPAAGIVAELVVPDPTNAFVPIRLFAETDETGQFAIASVPIGRSSQLTLRDPVGPGRAVRSVVATGTASDVGLVILDVDAPSVTSVTPAPSAVAVPLAATVRAEFSEPVRPDTVTTTTVTLSDGSSIVPALVSLGGGDKVATLTPLAPLAQARRYTLAVSGVRDLVGKPLAAPYTSSFTTIDLSPPAIIETSPAVSGNGVPIAGIVRVKYSEPIDPGGFLGPAITVSRSGTPVTGRIDVLFGGTVVVFTPSRPLDEDASYVVRVAPAVDLSGNRQPEGLEFTFSTTDRTPPVITALVAAGNGLVIDGGTTTVTAQTPESDDVALVDFYVNDVLSFTTRTAPFTFTLLASPPLGGPGAVVKVSALATDTSGNRGTVFATTTVTIVADAPPVPVITGPADGATVSNGQRVSVTFGATDDLGIARLGVRVETGRAQDAAAKTYVPPIAAAQESFGFNVPADFAPGGTLRITVSAVDSRGQTMSVTRSLTVLDAAAPTVAITGTSSGVRVSPGQTTQVIVAAQDAGGIRAIEFSTTGAVTSVELRTIDPAQPSVAAGFSVSVPASARSGDAITLRATATDVAGNTGRAADVVLSIADLNPPTLTLRTANGRLDATPGEPVVVIAEANDEIGVSRVTLRAEGAFAYGDAKSISPPTGSVVAHFSIPVPASAVNGQVLSLTAMAVDLFGNASAPATLALTIRALSEVTLPPSVLARAGDAVQVPVTLASPAPAGGLTVNFSSSNAAVVTAQAPVTIPAGQTSAPATLDVLRGGTAQVSALIQGVTRATTTVTAIGGVVRGTVLDPSLTPVAGAQVTVRAGQVTRTTVADADGNYVVDSIDDGQFTGTGFSVVALDGQSQLRGFATGLLDAAGGSARVNVVLVSAGVIDGVVQRPDGVTPAGAGVRVDLFDATRPSEPALATTFTDDNGHYEFPLVAIGQYRLDASDSAGNRGRTSAAVARTGEAVTADIRLLGRGTVTGVITSAGSPVPNARVRLTATSIFGAAPEVTVNAGTDGTYAVADVFVGGFVVRAQDLVTNQAGTVGGQVENDGQTVTADIALATWGALEGTVFRSDGTTPVAGATVSVSGAGILHIERVTTGSDGRYAFGFLPLTPYTVDVVDAASRGKGRAKGRLTQHTVTVTQNVTLLPQGTIVAAVEDQDGNRVADTRVVATVQNGEVFDSLEVSTDAAGLAILDRLLAGTYAVYAAAVNATSQAATGTLEGGRVIEVTLRLAARAAIVGQLLDPNGAPAIGSVGLGPFQTLAGPTQSDGTFRIEDLSVPGTYDLYAWDNVQYPRLRAIVRGVRVTDPGQVVSRTLTFIGLGTVRGRVINPDGSSAGSLPVTLRSLTPDYERSLYATTDAGGVFQIDGVPVGDYRVSVEDRARGLLGEASGRVERHEQVVQSDVLLANNAISLESPVRRYDANGFRYDISRRGHVVTGHSFVFGGGSDQTLGAFLLDVTINGQTTTFTGGGMVGTVEDGGREIVVRQNISGLDVTRKAFVPRSYFARYLEVLTNTTASPITVDLRVRHVINRNDGVAVSATSSGDHVLQVGGAAADRWATLSLGADGDPFTAGAGTVALGWLFDGDDAGTQAAAAGLVQPTQYGEFPAVTYSWSRVTVAPGQSVGLMHFGVQQHNQAAARASMERLRQLPPEALVGLSAFEIGAIRNFAVPADGSSPLPGLPVLAERVTGRVLEADATTPIPAINTFEPLVTLRSDSLLFGRAYRAILDGQARFTVTTGAADTDSQVSVFHAPFTVQVIHPVTRVLAPLAAGTFREGESAATLDVAFTNTAQVRGTVRRHTGTVVTSGTVVAQGTNLPLTTPTLAIGSDGSYRVSGLPAGTFSLTATVPSPGARPGDFPNTGTVSVTVAAGDVGSRDLPLAPTGSVTGTLRTVSGALAVNANVELTESPPNVQPLFRRSALTSTAGVFLLADVPVGTYVLQARDPATLLLASAIVTVTQDTATTRDLQYPGQGTVRVTARYPDGAPVVGGPVTLRRPDETFDRYPGVTDAQGVALVTGIPGSGPYTIRVANPRRSDLTGQVTDTITGDGQTFDKAVTVPALGDIAVSVRTASGDPAASALVDYQLPTETFFRGGIRVDTNGEGRLVNLAGTVTLRATPNGFPAGAGAGLATVTVRTDNGTTAVTVTLPPTGVVTGRVTTPDGVPVASPYMQVRGFDAFSLIFDGHPDGTYTTPPLPPGAYTMFAGERLASGGIGTFASVPVDLPPGVTSLPLDIVTDDVRTPIALVDANGRAFNLNETFALDIGTAVNRHRLAWTPPRAGLQVFTGSYSASPSLDGRQWSTETLDSLGRLRITRSAYVPADGYFLRYLDVFENKGSGPVTIDVQYFNQNPAAGSQRLAATSSGDAVLGTDDHWFVTLPQTTSGLDGLALSFVFAGPGAREIVDSVDANLALTSRWSSVTIPEGGRVAFLSFSAIHRDGQAALEVIQRLALLPPEAIAGLTAEERAAVVNFAVPADGASALAPFPLFRGRALAGDGSTGVAGARVIVSGTTTPFYDAAVTSMAGGDGAYAIRYPTSGAYALEARDEGTGAITTPATGTLAAGQVEVVRDLVFAATGGLRGQVTVDGTAATGGTVSVISSSGSWVVPIGNDGRYLAAVLPPGLYTLVATVGGRYSLPETATVTAQVVSTRDLSVVTVARTGTLEVRVRAGDGVTLVHAAQVAVVDVETGQNLGRAFAADVDGVYRFPGVTHQGQGMRVAIFATADYYDIFTPERLVAFSADGETRTVDFDVPLAVLRGRVTQNGLGMPAFVEPRQVSLTGEYAGQLRYGAGVETDASGNYTVLVSLDGPTGVFAYSADGSSAFLAERQVTARVSSATEVDDLVLPPTAALTGSVRDDHGQLVAGAHVYLYSPVLPPGALIVGQQSGGTFTIDAAPLGAVQVVACAATPDGANCGAAQATVVAGPSPASVDVRLPATGTVTGGMRTADGSTALAGKFVYLTAGASGGAGNRRFARTDDAGEFSFADVSAGVVSASVLDFGATAGFSLGTLAPGASLSLDVRDGSARWAGPLDLSDSAFRLSSACDGSVFGGGTTDNRLAPAVDGRWSALRVAGVRFDCLQTMRLELGGRQARYGPMSIAGLEVTRTVHVSQGVGGVSRHIEWLHNPTTSAITVDLEVGGELANPLEVVHSTGLSAVTRTGEETARVVLGHVWAGAGAAVGTPGPSWQVIGGRSAVGWRVAVPAGETVLIVHFLAQARTVEEADAAVEALATPAGLAAQLADLSPADRARIVNFVVP